MWPDLIAKSKEGGADVVQTYVFWSGHEPVKGQVCYIISLSLSLCVFSLSLYYVRLKVETLECDVSV